MNHPTIPSIILRINEEISQGAIDTLTQQLFLSAVYTKDEFDGYDGYLSIQDTVIQNKLRILVISNEAVDGENVFIFHKNGIISIESGTGPRPSFEIGRIHWAQILQYTIANPPTG